MHTAAAHYHWTLATISTVSVLLAYLVEVFNRVSWRCACIELSSPHQHHNHVCQIFSQQQLAFTITLALIALHHLGHLVQASNKGNSMRNHLIMLGRTVAIDPDPTISYEAVAGTPTIVEPHNDIVLAGHDAILPPAFCRF